MNRATADTQSALSSDVVDLEAYLRRIGHTGGLQPVPAVLEAIHLAHATHIPFENLDILLGRPIALDLASLQAKLVTGGRGGYCFEQNLLFSAMLQRLGFSVTHLAARVIYPSGRKLPRTHILLRVDAAGATWLADAGFGLEGLLLPVPFVIGREARQFGWTYRVVEANGEWTLQSLRTGGWTDLYSFSLEPQLAVDFEPANHYTATHPDSRFVRTLTVQLPTPEVRYRLRNRELVLDRGGTVTRRELADDDELLSVLAEVFGLRFPAGTRFRYREDA
ncbi:MAG TPA: arylamine N-acetyltransferase [Burkholderiales bacterium]|nr:arylamine N-acetyltransferase [Burkholderiales bacterium]